MIPLFAGDVEVEVPFTEIRRFQMKSADLHCENRRSGDHMIEDIPHAIRKFEHHEARDPQISNEICGSLASTRSL